VLGIVGYVRKKKKKKKKKEEERGLHFLRSMAQRADSRTPIETRAQKD
jgi:hypothetical protein